MSRIYVETSIASFYFEVRHEPEMVSRRNWTRRWFDAALIGTEQIVTSIAVIAELERGDFPGKLEALELFSQLPVEDVTEEVLDIAEAYVAHKVMPNDPAGDALHLAIASYHKCDFFGDVELQTPCQCKQVCTHPTRKRYTRHIQPVAGDSTGTAG